jgi:hypothetical protein
MFRLVNEKSFGLLPYGINYCHKKVYRAVPVSCLRISQAREGGRLVTVDLIKIGYFVKNKKIKFWYEKQLI